MSERFENVGFAATRKGAQARLATFAGARLRDYARQRNFVERGHENVSRLSPAISVRLLREREVVGAAHGAEKFTQEVCWRLYWKSWLELRPQVWTRYREALDRGFPAGVRERAAVVAAGRSGVAVMDHFARELVETGYLHNHVRMWFASFWVHVERLPWELGAAFFFDHLMDADAASNTLSWRWVAGRQTQGKTYLVRRANIERCLDPAILEDNLAGFGELPGDVDDPEAPPGAPEETVAVENWPSEIGDPGNTAGLVVHEDDLAPETSPLGAIRPRAVFILETPGEPGAPKATFRRRARGDAAARARAHFGCPVDTGTDLDRWAGAAGCARIVGLAPWVGEVRDALASCGREIAFVRRPEDAALVGLATGGFFPFWKQVRKWEHLSDGGPAPDGGGNPRPRA